MECANARASIAITELQEHTLVVSLTLGVFEVQYHALLLLEDILN